MRPHTVEHLPREVERLEDPENAQRLGGVEPLGADIIGEGFLADVAEWRVTHVVTKTNGFRERFVQSQHLSQGPADLCDLKCVGEAGDVVIILGVDEDLGFVLETAEGLRMQNAIPVALKGRPVRIRVLRGFPSLRLCGPGSDGGEEVLIGLARRPISLQQWVFDDGSRSSSLCPLRRMAEISPDEKT